MTLFDYDTKSTKRESLQQDMNADGFWNNQEAAQGVIAEFKLVKAQIEPLEEMIEKLEEAKVGLELAKEADDRELLEEARRAGWLRLRVDGEILETDGLEALDKRKKHDVEAVIDRLVAKSGIKSRLTESVETALRIGDGQLIASISGKDDQNFSEHAACGKC